MKQTPTAAQIEAAMMTAVDKMIATGMSREECAAYVNANLESILAWCFKLIAEA